MLTRQQIIGRVLDQSTLLQKYQEDIDDTIAKNNECMGVIADILSKEGISTSDASSEFSSLPLPIRVGYNDENDVNKYYYITKDSSNLPVISTYNESTNQFEKQSDIFREEEGHLVLWWEDDILEDNLRPTIYGLQYSVSDALGQATILSKLGDLIRNGSQNILTDFTSLCSATMDTATYGTKTMYTSICDNLSKSGTSFASCFEVLKTVYGSLSGMHANGNTFEFDNTDYRIEGFAFSNVIQAVGQTVAAVVSAVLFAISPIAGFAASCVTSAFTSLQSGLNTINERSHGQVNFETANNLLNVPLWHGLITKRSVYRNDTGSVNELIAKTGCATMVVPGMTLYLWEADQYNYAVEAYLNVSIPASMANWCHGQTFAGYSGSQDMTLHTNGCNYISFALSTYKDVPYDARTWINTRTNDPTLGPEYNPENAAFSCIIAALNTIFRIAATYNLGINHLITSNDGWWYDVDQIIQTLDHDPNHALDWEYLINELVYKKFRTLQGDDFEMKFMFPFAINRPTEFYFVDSIDPSIHFAQGNIPTDLVCYSGCAPVRSDFFISAPKFSNKASFNTLMVALAVIGATIAVIATAAVVKVKIRNSQIRSYSKVAQAQAALQADPTNQDLQNAYVKAVKSYNMKSNLFGYSSKLNMIDGWQEAKDKGNAGDVTVSGIYGSISKLSEVKNQNNSTQSKVDGVQSTVNNCETYSSNAMTAALSADHRLELLTPSIEWIPILSSNLANVSDDVQALKQQCRTLQSTIESVIALIKPVNPNS